MVAVAMAPWAIEVVPSAWYCARLDEEAGAVLILKSGFEGPNWTQPLTQAQLEYVRACHL